MIAQTHVQNPIIYFNMAIRCLWRVERLGSDCLEVEFAAGQVDYGGEVVHVPEASCPALHVLDDAVRVDVLQDLAHPAGAAGLEPLPREVAFGLQLQFGQAFLVPEPQVLGPFE